MTSAPPSSAVDQASPIHQPTKGTAEQEAPPSQVRRPLAPRLPLPPESPHSHGVLSRSGPAPAPAPAQLPSPWVGLACPFAPPMQPSRALCPPLPAKSGGYLPSCPPPRPSRPTLRTPGGDQPSPTLNWDQDLGQERDGPLESFLGLFLRTPPHPPLAPAPT